MFSDVPEETPKMLTEEEWDKYYRKESLEDMPVNVQANMYLLCLYAFPNLCPGYKNFGPNKTTRPLSASVYVSSEAFILLLAMEGHLDQSQEKDKKKSIVTKANVEKYIKLVERVTKARAEEVGGRAWEDSMMGMAVKLKKIEESKREKALQERRDARLGQMPADKRQEIIDASKTRKKRRKLVIPEVTQLPPVWSVTATNAISESSLSSASNPAITGEIGETQAM